MKTILAQSIRIVLLAASLAAVPSLSFALPRSLPALGIAGTIPVEVVNSASFPGSIQVGTVASDVVYRIGQPNVKLADGSWLYREFEVDANGAKGTLRLRFERNRVAGMSMISPTTEIALLQETPKPGQLLVASAATRR